MRVFCGDWSLPCKCESVGENCLIVDRQPHFHHHTSTLYEGVTTCCRAAWDAASESILFLSVPTLSYTNHKVAINLDLTSCFLVEVECVRFRVAWMLAWLRDVKRNNVRLGTNHSAPAIFKRGRAPSGGPTSPAFNGLLLRHRPRWSIVAARLSCFTRSLVCKEKLKS